MFFSVVVVADVAITVAGLVGFVGPALMVVADVPARVALWSLGLGLTRIPAGIVTGLPGGPYFLYIVRKRDATGEF